MKNVLSYFDREVEFTSDLVATDPFPLGTLWPHISLPLLNGMINYVDLKKAYLLDKATSWDEIVASFQFRAPAGGIDWQNSSPMPKKEAFALACEKGRMYHTNISMFEDDVLILAKDRTGKQWWFFWFTMDVGDCCIGRFVTDETDEEVLKSFLRFVEEPMGDWTGFHELPIHFFEGWLSF
jgi:hypothetical protein